MNAEKLHVGVIGGGNWGNFHMLAAKQQEVEGNVKLIAIADRNEEKIEEHSINYGIKKYLDYKEMILNEELDAITIATPDHLHKEIALFALEQNKHVLIEKPLDLSTDGCREIVDLAKKNKLLLTVDFHKRYDAYNADTRIKVQNGLIGRPYNAYAYMEDKISIPLGMLNKWADNSSPFWFIGVHKLDLIRWVTGLEPVKVIAKGYKGKLQELGLDVFDSISAWIEFDEGFTCTIQVNWIVPNQFEALVNQGIRIVGSDGFVELDCQDRGLRYCSSNEGTQTPNLGALVMQKNPFGYQSVSGYYVDPIKEFYSNAFYLKKGGLLDDLEGLYPSGYDGLVATQTAEAVHRSITENRLVELSEI